MPNPFMSIGGNSPQMQAYLERNPNGFFASIFGNQSRPSDPNIGSNNGGVAIGSNGNTPTTQVGGPNTDPGGSNNADGFSGAMRGPYVSMNRDLPAQQQMPAGSYRYDNSMVGQMGFRRNPGENHSVAQNTGMTQQPTSFAAGGMVTEDGGAIRPDQGMGPPSAGTGRTLPRARFKVEPQEPQLGAASAAPVDSNTIDQEAQKFIQQNPQEAQKVQALMAAAIQSGELTSQELNQVVQLAKTALANPSSYPQIRQFAIKNGLGTEEEIPQQLDQGLLYTLIVIGKSMQAIGPTGSPTQPSAPAGPPVGNAMTGQPPAPAMENGMLPSYEKGGPTGDTAHLAKVHAREYVIPEKAMLYHGKKFFDAKVREADEAENGQKE